MVRMGFEKIIPEFSISKVIVGADRFAGVCLTSLPSDQLRNHLLLFSVFGLEGINNSFTICSFRLGGALARVRNLFQYTPERQNSQMT